MNRFSPFFHRNHSNRNEFANIYLQTPNDLVNFFFYVTDMTHNHLRKQCEKWQRERKRASESEKELVQVKERNQLKSINHSKIINRLDVKCRRKCRFVNTFKRSLAL